jgi:hypothetical protein
MYSEYIYISFQSRKALFETAFINNNDPVTDAE